mgnify:CR=1 FL=1
MHSMLDTLLAPFARLMVAQGVLFPDLMERLKAHYVTAATAQSDGKVTDSRLSVMTGLQRRDIVRLRETPAQQERPNHLATLVALWQTNPDYAGKALPKNGPAPSFETLARAVRRDVHPRTMLDALLAAGTVTHTDDIVTLVQSSYQPLAGSEDQLAYLPHNLGAHMSAATDNVLGQQPPHFERAVHYTDLTVDQISELRAEHKAGQMELFERLSRKAGAMKALPNAKGQHRFRAGAYFYPHKDES